MRNFFGIGLVLLTLFAEGATVQAGEAEALVERAIEAHGGKEKLIKARRMTWTDKGKFYGSGMPFDFTGNYASELPGRYRMEIPGAFAMVIDGDKGFTISGKVVSDMSKQDVQDEQEAMHARYAGNLVHLLDEDYHLEYLGESEADDRVLLGVKVEHKGNRDLKLYFDKETALLAKISSRVVAQDLGGKEVDQDFLMSEYQDLDGLKMHTKIVVNRDGEKLVETTMSDVEFPEKLDEETFARPK